LLSVRIHPYSEVGCLASPAWRLEGIDRRHPLRYFKFLRVQIRVPQRGPAGIAANERGLGADQFYFLRTIASESTAQNCHRGRASCSPGLYPAGRHRHRRAEGLAHRRDELRRSAEAFHGGAPVLELQSACYAIDPRTYVARAGRRLEEDLSDDRG